MLKNTPYLTCIEGSFRHLYRYYSIKNCDGKSIDSYKKHGGIIHEKEKEHDY